MKPEHRDKLLEYIEDFSREVVRFDGDEDIALALTWLRFHRTAIREETFEDMQAANRVQERRNYGFFRDVLEDRTLFDVAETAFKTVLTAKELWRASRRDLASDAVESTYKKFGLSARLNHSGGQLQDRGEFFTLSEEEALSSVSSMEMWKGLESICFDGIDQNGLGALQHQMVKTSQAISGHRTGLYHYACAPSVLGASAGKIITDRGAADPIHFETAKTILEHREKPGNYVDLDWLSVRYSNGVLYGLGVDNAIWECLTDVVGSYRLSEDVAERIFQKQRIFSVGMQPLWDVPNDPLGYSSCPEVTIVSSTDVITATSEYLRGIFRTMITHTRDDPDNAPAVRAFSFSENPNKVALMAAPGAVYYTLSNGNEHPVANFGGHGFHHYVASLGLIPGIDATCDLMAKAGKVVRPFLESGIKGDKTLHQQFEEAGIPVEILDKDQYRGTLLGVERIEAHAATIQAHAMQIAEEYLETGKHLLLQNGNGRQR